MNLLARKMLVAFLVAFGGVLLPAVLDILDKLTKGQNVSFTRGLIFALLAGAFSAGLRAVLALLPINLIPSDKLHTAFKRKPAAVVVDRAGNSDDASSVTPGATLRR